MLPYRSSIKHTSVFADKMLKILSKTKNIQRPLQLEYKCAIVEGYVYSENKKINTDYSVLEYFCDKLRNTSITFSDIEFNEFHKFTTRELEEAYYFLVNLNQEEIIDLAFKRPCVVRSVVKSSIRCSKQDFIYCYGLKCIPVLNWKVYMSKNN